MDDYVLYSNIKEIDLHGYDRFSAKIEVLSFVKESYFLKLKYVGIIHGKGSGILKRVVFDTLKNNEYVEDYKIDLFNSGRTIVKLKDK